MKNKIKKLLFILGLLLLMLNFYGLSQNISPDIKKLDGTYGLRFPYTDKKTYAETLKMLDNTTHTDNHVARVKYLSDVIKQRMTHPNWHKVPSGEFNISVPIWENYILYALRFVYNEPQIARYHFSDYKKSLERGIGICGDSAIILSSLLRKENIKHDILVYPGHVIIRFEDEQGNFHYADSDFNVVFPDIKNTPLSKNKTAIESYLIAGYSKSEVDYLASIYSGSTNRFDDHIHFMTKRYYFEKISYYLKWLIPFLLCIPFSLMLFEKNRRRHTNNQQLKQ